MHTQNEWHKLRTVVSNVFWGGGGGGGMRTGKQTDYLCSFRTSKWIKVVASSVVFSFLFTIHFVRAADNARP